MRVKHVVIALCIAAFVAMIGMLVADAVLDVIAPAIGSSWSVQLVVFVVVLIVLFIFLLYRMRGLADYEEYEKKRREDEAEAFVAGDR